MGILLMFFWVLGGRLTKKNIECLPFLLEKALPGQNYLLIFKNIYCKKGVIQRSITSNQ